MLVSPRLDQSDVSFCHSRVELSTPALRAEHHGTYSSSIQRACAARRAAQGGHGHAFRPVIDMNLTRLTRKYDEEHLLDAGLTGPSRRAPRQASRSS
jgi:hypothetical protein